MQPYKAETQLIRVGSNCHRYIMRVNGKIRSFTMHERDFQFDVAVLFACFNQGVFPARMASLQFWVAMGLSVLLTCPVAFALPTGWHVVSGNVTIDQTGNTLNVTSSSNQAIVNYQSFNLANGETVNFNFLLPGSSILNRVLGGGPSTIAGNGQVLLVNPAYLFPHAKPDSSTSTNLSVTTQTSSPAPHQDSTPTQPSLSTVQLQEPEPTMDPGAAQPVLNTATNTGMALTLDTAHNAVLIKDPTTGKSLAQIPVGNKPIALIENHKNGLAFVANEADKTISVIDTHSHTVIQTIPVSIRPTALELSPDGQQLKVFDRNTHQVIIINTSHLSESAKPTPDLQNSTLQILYEYNRQLKSNLDRLIDSYFQGA